MANVKPTPPVRRYADVVRHLIQTMTLVGFPGDRSVALHLARTGWKLSRRTVQRIRREKPILPPTAAPMGPSCVVSAKYANHVWMLDLTEIPGFLRLFLLGVRAGNTPGRGFPARGGGPGAQLIVLSRPSRTLSARGLRCIPSRRREPILPDEGARHPRARVPPYRVLASGRTTKRCEKSESTAQASVIPKASITTKLRQSMKL